MVWIELDSDLRRAIWVDGYIPPFKKVERKLKNLGIYSQSSYVEPGWTRLDEMVRNLICAYRNTYHREASRKGEAELHLCDIFYSKTFLLKLPQFWEKDDIFYKEIINEKENYRQLIIGYEPESCKVGRSCARNLIKRLGFEIKKPEEYKNYEKFREVCQRILYYAVIEPYEAPCIIARERLKNKGFFAACDQS